MGVSFAKAEPADEGAHVLPITTVPMSNMTSKHSDSIIFICTTVSITVQPQALIASMLEIHVAN